MCATDQPGQESKIMIIGAHVMLHSKDRDADIAFFRDILSLPNVDAGEGYMLFGIPSSEVAIHAEKDGDANKLYLMCDDVGAFIKEMEARGIPVKPVEDQGWGSLTEVTLPGGGALSVYQPHHPRPAAGGGGGGGRGRGGKGKAAKGRKSAKGRKGRAAALSPERQAKREERKKARATSGSAAAAGRPSKEDRKARRDQRKEERKTKRAEKKAARTGSAGGSKTDEKS
jgi:catechol 2,3-dioxygenase-like lactoylglutathione lyase family enzyme